MSDADNVNASAGSNNPPLAPWLQRGDVTDIYVNAPGEIWIETTSGAIERIPLPDLTHRSLERLARQIAAFSHQGISREHPVLSATLPDGSRAQIVIPPATRGSVAIAIRRHLVMDRSLADYERDGSLDSNDRDSNDTSNDRLREVLAADGVG